MQLHLLRRKKPRIKNSLIHGIGLCFILIIVVILLNLIHQQNSTEINSTLNSEYKVSRSDSVKFQKTDDAFMYTDPINIHLVIAFCKANMTWIHDDLIAPTLKLFNQSSFHINIMSKCGNEVDIPDFNHIDAVKTTNIISIQNVGGCDYAYAKYFNHFKEYSLTHSDGPMNSNTNSPSDVVLFLKDIPRTNETFHHSKMVYKSYRSITEMISMALNGTFVCGLDIFPSFSEYHHIPTLYNFTIMKYARASDKSFEPGPEQFNPYGYTNLRDFHLNALGWEFPRNDYTRVCYGGSFAVPQHRIVSLMSDNRISRVMKQIEDSMSEGHLSIAEHFIERTWAGLISKPLTEDESVILKSTAIGIHREEGAIFGALYFKKPKRSTRLSKRSYYSISAIVIVLAFVGIVGFRRGRRLWVLISSLMKER